MLNKKIVFDLDGTLITCRNRQVCLLNAIIKRFPNIKEFDFERWWQLKRNGFTTKAAMCAIGVNEESSLITKCWINDIENINWLNFDVCFDDTINTLRVIKDVGYRTYILTARKNKYNLFSQINNLGLNRFIEDIFVVRPDEVIRNKSEILRKLNPIIYTGDTEMDSLAAEKANINFIAVNRGQRSENYLNKCNVLKIYSNLDFIIKPISKQQK